MRTRIATANVGHSTYIDDEGDTIGEIYVIPAGEDRTVYLAFAHNWESDSQEYVPECLNAFDDVEEAVAQIERRAREAQAPTTLLNVDGLLVEGGQLARWATSGIGDVSYLVARVGSTLVACNPAPPSGDVPLVVIHEPKTGTCSFRVHGDSVADVAALIVAALLITATSAEAAEANTPIPRATIRKAGQVLQGARQAAGAPERGGFPELRELLTF
ncbi:Hypothetical protein AJAP_42780 (plasmid) [Amycolatopsis japonica]|uniref:Uncharacterized protein n=1 Tax=Amycolatopsis japonica TaxID=208439 RepID=A0A075V771_9PSEU|nr:hypothetical protein [Amycolatopsis japonica]AIG81323.1 Hypothetical protein AJAP_42780 [Amycolatopsis japonica]